MRTKGYPQRGYGSSDANNDPGASIEGLPRRVIVKFYDDSPTAAVAALEADAQRDNLAQAFEGYNVVPVVTSVSGDVLDRLHRIALEDGAASDFGNLKNFMAIEVPTGEDPVSVVTRASDVQGVEYAYVEPRPAPPPVAAANNPRSVNQGYLDAAPIGVDARYAWTVPGGDGSGVGFVDLEQGWRLDHEDLVAQNIQLISGANAAYHDHGTAVLGEVCAVDNTVGDIGIVPSASVRVVSQHQPGGYSTAGAIISAVLVMDCGDVLLLEAQDEVNGFLHPVEIDPVVFIAIRVAVALGITVVEAGANGTPPGMAPGLNLDTATNPAGRFVLDRNHAEFRDSGAIIVGAASSATPHARLGFSNYGNRVDCFAWGENIDTTDTTAALPTSAYLPDAATGRVGFSGTSGASPMVASAAVALQGMVKALNLAALSPREVRRILSDPAINTASANPAVDRIGVMPNLRRIYERAVLPLTKNAPGDYPLPANPDVAYAGRGTRPSTRSAKISGVPTACARAQTMACIDAGHGGSVDRGRSTAYGGHGVGCSAEKEVNLKLARGIRRQLGGSVLLTRDGDYNLSLGERISLARQSEAPVFVSVHANNGPRERRGTEVWVYGSSSIAPSSASQALALAVSDALAHCGLSAEVHSGDLAVLHPAHHRPGTAACLVEADYLSNPQGRLRDAREVETIAGAVARGVRRYMARN